MILKCYRLHQELTKKLPEDHGPVRVVSIQGIDNNMCCGTHVTNLSHLQAIKLLNVEKGKKGKTNLFFLSGQRVLDYISRSLIRERQLTAVLKLEFGACFLFFQSTYVFLNLSSIGMDPMSTWISPRSCRTRPALTKRLTTLLLKNYSPSARNTLCAFYHETSSENLNHLV